MAPNKFPVWYAAQPKATAMNKASLMLRPRTPPYLMAMICPRFLPEAMVIRAAVSCKMIAAMVEKLKAHNNCKR